MAHLNVPIQTLRRLSPALPWLINPAFWSAGPTPIPDSARGLVSHYRVGWRRHQHNEAFEGPCIFVAEDNQADVDLLRMTLEEQSIDCELLVATDGDKALQFIELVGAGIVSRPSLAILDLNLPKRSGAELLRRMRQDPVWSKIRVVILSSSDSHKDKLEAAQLGASKYIRKPSNLQAFSQVGVMLKNVLSENT